MTFLRAIWRDLRTADDFSGDWYKWAGSATMHAAIVGPLLAFPVLWLGVPAEWVGAVVGALYIFFWEAAVQWFEKGLVDAWLDSLMVALGALIAAQIGGNAIILGCYLAALAVLAAGVWERAK